MTANTTFYVMAPPDADPDITAAETAERLVFVPDRFSILAFAFSVPWMLVHRMWFVLLGYLALTLAIELVAFWTVGAAAGVAALAVSFAFGLEAQGLRKWSLERKGYRQVGLVAAGDLEEAEIRFFHGTLSARSGPQSGGEEDGPVRSAPARVAGWPVPRIGSEQVIGLTLGRETRR
ncbi:hypothetical protein GCM10011316_10650 [Roseibium aquae]|uniref:DUF2628 domain-containing protein n=1 Tax=Roseibium aquae TaxID=1323746 RepID=A0A916TEL8_9HYPH|nr:DUF2628 domain-containing protein [Roseibium aquae]GGB40448.1 hypothetical protein GCM10011316_10650 [Roseibium aquae]